MYLSEKNKKLKTTLSVVHNCFDFKDNLFTTATSVKLTARELE